MVLLGCSHVDDPNRLTVHEQELLNHKKAIDTCFVLGGVPILSPSGGTLKDCKFPFEPKKEQLK